ncbi:type VI secretion system lipoprotein TssJ [Kistimonas asteriae]|uniref:type VI secretion system lipoprotein TssJ n=1 Tax=Kistimonas asteriae TaxID=517724 RepID=UPI001BACD479|nr:type VI secretion system lipoprotein TssJ [Kistimonas asteriae]
MKSLTNLEKYYLIAILCCYLLLQGCSFNSGHARYVDIVIKASHYINPSDNQEASPVFVKIYQLSDYGNFQMANFLDLYQNKADVALGNQLVHLQPPVSIRPGDVWRKRIELEPQARYIGFLVQFRHYEDRVHRQWLEIKERGSQCIQLGISGLNLSLNNRCK